VFDLLVDYLKSGRIKLDKSLFGQRVAYHDPCNYGRKSEEVFGHGYYEEPRWVLDQFVPNWVDLYPAKANNYCCGGGGGHMWIEEQPGTTKINQMRIEDVLKTGAEMVVTACPYCLQMFEESIEHKDMKDSLKARDLVELVEAAMKQ